MLLATVAGLAVAIWAFGATGLHDVLAAIARLGVSGLLVFCAYSLLGSVLLGAAWLAAAPGEPVERLMLFTWARIVREGASDLLPFSQIGGVIVGARTVVSGGVAPARAYGSMIVDMTTEMAGQIAFTLFGIAMFVATIAAGPEAQALRPLVFVGTGVTVVVMGAFLLAQRAALGLAARLAGRVLPESGAMIAEVRIELERIYADRPRVALAFLFNLVAWVASASGAWIVLYLMGSPVPLWAVLTIESLIFTLRSVAFAIPGAIGVQEAAYVLLGPLLGVPAEMALALSLAKRARELLIGLPAVLAWQAQEARAALSRSAAG